MKARGEDLIYKEPFPELLLCILAYKYFYLTQSTDSTDKQIRSMQSLTISLGAASLKLAFRAVKSSDLTCSQRMVPVVFVRSSRGTCNGKGRAVLVIGQTSAKLVTLLKKSLLITKAGRRPVCSWPLFGLKSIVTMSPCRAL